MFESDISKNCRDSAHIIYIEIMKKYTKYCHSTTENDQSVGIKLLRNIMYMRKMKKYMKYFDKSAEQ